MFTGLVQTLAQLKKVETKGKSSVLLLSFTNKTYIKDVKIGDSIAINGCCLSATAKKDSSLSFDCSPETLALTNLGALKLGDKVNCEKSLRLQDFLGGHLVSGHIEALAEVTLFQVEQAFATLAVKVPRDLSRYCIAKGSITLNGVSLTINRLQDKKNHSIAEMMLIPETMKNTNLSNLKVGSFVNLETDILAKYMERLTKR